MCLFFFLDGKEKSLTQADEKLQLLEARMANIITKVDIQNVPELKEEVMAEEPVDEEDYSNKNMGEKKVIKSKAIKKTIKTDLKEKKTRKRAVNDDHDTKMEENVEGKTSKKEEKLDNIISPIKRNRRAVVMDKLASNIPNTLNNQKKNQKDTKSTITTEEKPKGNKRVLKKEEQLPIVAEKHTKPIRTTRTTRKPLSYVIESDQSFSELPTKPKLKPKATTKKQVKK